MAVGYTKDFLIDAYMSIFKDVGTAEDRTTQRANAVKLYDQVGKDKFRVYASLDADAIKVYKNKS